MCAQAIGVRLEHIVGVVALHASKYVPRSKLDRTGARMCVQAIGARDSLILHHRDYNPMCLEMCAKIGARPHGYMNVRVKLGMRKISSKLTMGVMTPRALKCVLRSKPSLTDAQMRV